MPRYQLILSYDGTHFSGSQRQANARTVQGELERALRALGWLGRSVVLAARTDSGVHATGQVAAVDLDWPHDVGDLQNALNARLPLDLVVRDIKPAQPDFHPRFSANSRRYLYSLFCEQARNPLRERYAWRVWPDIEPSLLVRATELFDGNHDFAAFGSATSPGGTTWRRIKSSEWRALDGVWQFEIEADAFLYHMVRRIAFAHVAVAQGRCTLDDLWAALSSSGPVHTMPASRVPAGLAPAHGLVLAHVTYGPENIKSKRSVESVQDILSESR